MAESDTWERKEDLKNAKELVDKFERRLGVSRMKEVDLIFSYFLFLFLFSFQFVFLYSIFRTRVRVRVTRSRHHTAGHIR